MEYHVAIAYNYIQQDELSFDFDGIVLNSVNKHKHLGIIIRSKFFPHLISSVCQIKNIKYI
jgi:hypothetical protein